VTDAKAPDQAAHLGRLGTAAAWISAVCCLPYLALKVLWTVDVPLGIDDRSVLVRNDWVAGNAVMAVVQLTGLLVVLGLTWPCAHRMPTWLLLIPVWVGTGLLFEVVVGAVLMGVFSASSQASGGSNDFGGIQPWVFVMVYSSFAGQGIALAIAFACHVRSRWGRLLGQRTSEVLARPTARAGSWVEVHLVGMAEAVAGMAVAVALVCGYWAAGGSFGASGAQPDPTRALQASGWLRLSPPSLGCSPSPVDGDGRRRSGYRRLSPGSARVRWPRSMGSSSCCSWCSDQTAPMPVGA
jgi:hypothetical protein